MERLAHELLDKESLDGEQVYEIIREMTGIDLAPQREQPKAADSEDPEPSEVAAAALQEDSDGLAGEGRVGATPTPRPADPLPSTD